MAVIIQKEWYLSRLAVIIQVTMKITHHSMIISQQTHIPQLCLECARVNKVFFQNRLILSDHLSILSGPTNYPELAKRVNAQTILREPFQTLPNDSNDVLCHLSELIAQLAFGERVLDELGLAAHLSKNSTSKEELWWMRDEHATYARRLFELQRCYLHTLLAKTDGLKNEK
ncbi:MULTISPECIES: hypothetical protein [Pseudomonas]|uniref:hypothetical protein n=1 Tax=Pseudomonas TaxID=286 RepID=UPI000A901E90|nr:MULTISPECIES: hypothetical protein [Pseudomonas]MEB0106901.1 hypothetical protein [Pseudomonas sp. MH9.3]WPX79482.1 hypothetical protein RHM60_25185 [Pseudomonas sp. MH9.3]WQG58361.1 hypothetical protein RHM66_01055 [Pseudomonas sp. RTB3]